MKGRFVSYLQEQVVVGFNSSCYDIHWRKRTCWNICFCLVLLKQDKRSEGYGKQKSRMSWQNVILLWICFAVIVKRKQNVLFQNLRKVIYRKDFTFRKFWDKTFGASDYIYLNNILPEAKCMRKCINFICWNAFSVLNIWLLVQQCKVCFPRKRRWMTVSIAMLNCFLTENA